MTQLVRYDAACKAVTEAKTTDEAKEIRNTAQAMRAYARQAKNRSMEIDAAEIRMRAEYRLGELIKAQKETVGLSTGTAGRGRPKKGGTSMEPPKDVPPTLSEAGIDKKLSARSQKLANLSKDEFENRVAEWRDNLAGANERVTLKSFRDEPAEKKPEKAAPPKKANAAVAQMDPVSRCVATVRRIIDEQLSNIPMERWDELFSELHEEIDHIKQVSRSKSNGNGYHADNKSSGISAG